MRSNIKYLILALLIVFIFTLGSVSANDLDNATVNTADYDSINLANVSDEVISDQSDEITVNNWEDLQLYCAKDDKDYVLRLKEDTNYYPTDPEDDGYQIQVRNNVTILGNSGAYIGDSSPKARSIEYLAITVPENSGIGITLKGVTFKWISTEYQPNAVFLQMAGNSNNYIEDCQFSNSTLDGGHSSLLYLLRGYASITNSTFTDIISDYGCLSIYDPTDGTCTRAHMDVADSYFEGNYARTEPGCINNCGVLVVRNSTFYKNTAFWWAGAIHTHTNANTTIYDSNFTDNLAGWNGGALCTYSYLQIYNTIFIGNNCTTNNGGGAIYAYNQLSTPHIYVKDSLFKDNENLCWSLTELSTEGVGRGGAISINEGDLTVLNTTFIKNSAAIGTAICIIDKGSNYAGTYIVGNRFINHTRIGDVLILDSNSFYEIRDNDYLNNSIEFSKLKLSADDKVGDEVTLHIDASLKNAKYYDSDILEKSKWNVYVDGQYYMTVSGKDFTLNLKNLEKCQVYVVPSISNSKSNAVSVGLPKEYIYVSQKYGDDAKNGSSRQSSVATITKACELAKSCGNIVIMDGSYSESDIFIDYNLTIAGEDGVKFTGAVSNTIFTVSNSADFKISNIAFESIVFSNKNNGILRQNSGFTVVDHCVFNYNYVISSLSGNTLIEAKSIEVYGSEFTNHNKNNAHMLLIKSDEFLIDNCTFSDNVALNSAYNSLISTSSDNTGVNGIITNSVFKSNTVKYGCVYFGAKNNVLTITNTRFIANRVSSSSDYSSCIWIGGSPKVQIDSSVFMHNVDLGSRSAAIYVSGADAQIYVSDSVIIDNSFENSNNAVFSASLSSNMKVYKDLNGNWWGNTGENFTVAPPAYASACSSWLFLNASANSTSISKNQKVLITYDLNNQFTRSGDKSFYDAGKFKNIGFIIETAGGVAGDREISLENGKAQTVYTLTAYEGSIAADYNGFRVIINFTHEKIRPDMTITADDIYIGETATVEIALPDDVWGNLTVGDVTKVITGPKTTFTLSNLNAGENVIEVIYSGDEHWLSSTEKVTVNVNKYDSTTRIFYDNVDVGDDLTLNIDVTETATGNVTLIINNMAETLTLTNSKAQYTIKSVARGNYNITAIYNGDSKYASSKDNVRMGVGKVNPVFSVIVLDIAYAQDAVVDVTLNDNATGMVYVSVDDKNNASKVENGKATASISGLDVGLKTAYVNYDGDEYYNSFATSVSFVVSKADTTLTVNANDIKVGTAENIEVTVPTGVTGNVTIVCGENIITKAINVIGKVTWTLYDLPVGQYDVSATLISNNYNSIENTTEFEVSDYQTPQWPNQGYDIGNGGKSPYVSESNGAIIWSYEAGGNIMKNIAIDCDGNVCIVTTSGVYSIDDAGNCRWRYSYVDENISGIAISRDVVIIPISGNSLFFVNQTTGQRYGYSHVYQASSQFAPVVDSNSNVYVSSEYQYASGDYKLVIIPYKIWENGGNPTLISLGKSQPVSAPVIVADSYAVVACSDGIKIIDLAKKELSATISGTTQGVRPVAGSGNIIYAVLNNNIQAMAPQGTVIWKKAITASASQLVLDEENGLYLINSAGNLYRYALVDGGEELISALNFTSGMLIGNDGNLYVGADEFLYALDRNGNILWKSDMGDKIVGTPVMDENGTIYLTTSNSLKAIGKSDLADANLDVAISDISSGENATVLINISNDLTGIIEVEIDSKKFIRVIDSNNLIITVPDLSSGHKTVKITYSGDGRFKPKEVSCEFSVFGESQIIAENAAAYYGSSYVIALKDMQGNAISGEILTVNIGTNEYALITDENGEVAVSLAISPDTYQVTSTFASNGYLNASSKTTELTISSTIQASEMKRGYNSGTDFKATFLTSDGSPLANAVVSFTVNGAAYNVTTDSDGVAVLNAKLSVGSYDVTIINLGTGENATQKVTIVKRITNNKDLAMDYLDGSYFKVRVVGDDGSYVGKNQVVTFKIGGKSYTAKTDANGYAKIKITLVPKTYSVSTEYKGYKVSNKIVVKQVLKAKNVSKKKAKSYKFQATLKTSKGKAISGKKLTFKIKNKKYTAKTNKKGVATITIKLKLKVGKYTVTTTYSKTSIKNKLTVKK